jgi:hypothetical protein
MHPSRPCLYLLCPRLALLLSLMLLAGPASCRPASSDNAPVLESRANVDGQDYGSEAGGTGREGGSSEVIVSLAWEPV